MRRRRRRDRHRIHPGKAQQRLERRHGRNPGRRGHLLRHRRSASYTHTSPATEHRLARFAACTRPIRPSPASPIPTRPAPARAPAPATNPPRRTSPDTGQTCPLAAQTAPGAAFTGQAPVLNAGRLSRPGAPRITWRTIFMDYGIRGACHRTPAGPAGPPQFAPRCAARPGRPPPPRSPRRRPSCSARAAPRPPAR